MGNLRPLLGDKMTLHIRFKLLYNILICVMCVYTFLPVCAQDDKILSFVMDIPLSTCTPPDSLTSPNATRGRSHVKIFPHQLKGDTHQSMIVDEKRHIIVDWTPKSACTKVVEMFWKEMNITRGRNYPHAAFVHNYRPSFYLKCGTVSEDMLASDKYYKFKVVRNPFNRAVSSYLHLMKTNITHTILDGRKGKVFHIEEAQYEYPWNNLSFEQFLTLYKERIRPKLQIARIHGKVPNSAIFHFESQSSVEEMKRFTAHQKSIFNRIVHLEQFDADIALVNFDTHMNYSYPKGVDVHVVKKSVQPDVYHGDRLFADLKDNIPFNYGKFYNGRTKALVQNIFANDLKIYNYSFPFLKLY